MPRELDLNKTDISINTHGKVVNTKDIF